MADTVEKYLQLLRSDALPDHVKFVVKSSPEGPSEHEIRHAVDIPSRHEIGQDHVLQLLGLNEKDDSSLSTPRLSSLAGNDLELEIGATSSSEGIHSVGALPETNSVLIESVNDLVEQLSERNKLILESRLSGYAPRLTLEETANLFGLSRERVRQIEAEIVAKYRAANADVRDQVKRIPAMLREATELISLENVGAYSSDLIGIERWWRLVSRSMGKKFEEKVQLVLLEEKQILSRIHEVELEEQVRSFKDYIQQNIQDGRDVRLHDLWDRVWDQLANIQPGLVDAIVELACKDAVLINDDDENEVIVAYGRGANSAVVGVLRTAENAMTYEEVWKALGQSFELRRIHNALQEIAILLGRGTYGLREHIDYTDVELQEIADFAEDLILEDPDHTRQWHAREIFELVAEEFPEKSEALSVYHVQYALSYADNLASLRRMVWGRSSQYESSAEARRERAGLIQEILEKADGPLTNSEIKTRLSEMRGTGAFFQIFPDERVIRVGRGLWGLRQRDVPFNENFVGEARRLLVTELENSQRGVRVIDMGRIPGLEDVPSIQLVALASVLVDQTQLAFARGGLVIYLKAWGDSRLSSVRQAIREIFSEKDIVVPRHEIGERILAETGTLVEPFILSSALSASEFCEFDPVDRVWRSVVDLIEDID